MSPTEALEWAAKYVLDNKVFEAPLNSRGYVVDGFKSATPTERIEIITKLANEARQPAVTVNACEHGYAICAPCGMLPPSILEKVK